MSKIEKQIRVRAFGVLREVADLNGVIEVSALGAGTARDLKRGLEEKLQREYPDFDSSVIQRCAVADDRDLLGEDSVLDPSRMHAILPPVCGG